MNMPFKEGYDLIKYASDEEDDNKLFLRWVVGYQSATTFEEFKNMIRQQSRFNDNRSAESILNEVESMMSQFKV